MLASIYEDKAVLVTGAGSGIGFALCQAYARSGANVALNDIDPDLAERAAASINTATSSQRVAPSPGDVADVECVRTMIETHAARNGRLDIVIANAGITTYGAFLDFKTDAFDRLTGVNLRGSYFTAQAAARKMIELGTTDGRILLTASVTGIQALPNLGAYGVTKAGIRHMAKVIAPEIAHYGITVNAICPGATLTERNLADDPEYGRKWALLTPSGRVGSVDDIVATAMFLTAPEASHITGQTIVVDGGWTLSSPLP